jgi:hypothetical protein
METIATVPVEELKEAGLTNADIEYVREKTLVYETKISGPGMITATHGPDSVKAMCTTAFEAGVVMGLIKARGLVKLEKKIGF